MRRLFFILFFILGIVAAFCKESRYAEIDFLFDKNMFDVSDIPLGIIPGQGLCAALGSKIVGLDVTRNDSFKEIALEDSTVVIDEFVITEKYMAFHSDNSIFWNTSNRGFDGIMFNDNLFSIALATDSTLFVIRKLDNEIFEIDLKSKSSLWSTRFDEPIVSVFRIGQDIVLVSSYKIALFVNGEWNILHNHPIEIVSSAITPYGIFFGTSDALWRIHGVDEIQYIARGAISHILFDRDILYIVDNESNVYTIPFKVIDSEVN